MRRARSRQLRLGHFLRGGGGLAPEGGGFHTTVRGAMFVRNGAMTPGPSRECDITFAEGRPKSAQQSRDSTVAARRAQSVTVPSSRVTVAVAVLRWSRVSGRRTSGTSRSSLGGSCRPFLHFLGKIAVQTMSGKAPESPRHPSSRHPRSSKTRKCYAAPIGAFFLSRNSCVHGFCGEISSTISKVFSDRKVLFKHKNGAVKSR